MKNALLGLAAALVTAAALPAHAQIRITEVAPWASGNSPYAADWFELTNFGPSAVDITGWKMDDTFTTTPAPVALRGVTSIPAGGSAIFIESDAAGMNDVSIQTAFQNAWFGATPPAGVLIGNYGGSGVGLSTGGDAVNIFDGGNALQASVSFGASPGAAPFATFDNAAGLNGVPIALLSSVGVNGAFVAANDLNEIGSPAAIPEPETYALLLAGLLVLAAVARRRAA